MTNPNVRIIGRVTDTEGRDVVVSQDYDGVAIDAPASFILGPGARDDFARHFFAADEAAKAYAAAQAVEAAEEEDTDPDEMFSYPVPLGDDAARLLGY